MKYNNKNYKNWKLSSRVVFSASLLVQNLFKDTFIRKIDDISGSQTLPANLHFAFTNDINKP